MSTEINQALKFSVELLEHFMKTYIAEWTKHTILGLTQDPLKFVQFSFPIKHFVL